MRKLKTREENKRTWRGDKEKTKERRRRSRGKTKARDLEKINNNKNKNHILLIERRDRYGSAKVCKYKFKSKIPYYNGRNITADLEKRAKLRITHSLCACVRLFNLRDSLCESHQKGPSQKSGPGYGGSTFVVFECTIG